MKQENGLGIFDPRNSDPECRISRDITNLEKQIAAIRVFGHKIVLTMGTFDLAHIGHYRYLAEAKKHGDFLVVGVDSDQKTRARKGPHRPIVQEEERMELLCHVRSVDFIILKSDTWERWELIKRLRPDVLIATAETYTAEEVQELQSNYCGQVVVLEPQATTSTTAKVRKILVEGLDRFKRKVQDLIPEVLDKALEEVLDK